MTNSYFAEAPKYTVTNSIKTVISYSNVTQGLVSVWDTNNVTTLVSTNVTLVSNQVLPSKTLIPDLNSSTTSSDGFTITNVSITHTVKAYNSTTTQLVTVNTTVIITDTYVTVAP